MRTEDKGLNLLGYAKLRATDVVEITTLEIPLLALEIASYIYISVGVALGFFGRVIWGRLMTLLGILLGASLGYTIGALILQGFGALAIALLGAAAGGMIFTWLAEVAVAGMAGALGLYATYRSLLDLLGADQALIAGILVMLIIFSFTFYYMRRVMSYVTAIVGGVLTGAGLFLLTNDLQISFLAAAGIAIFGTVIQESVIRKYEEKIRAAMKKRMALIRRR